MNAYFEYPGKVMEIDKRFKHAMAITLDPSSRYKEGIIRCITSRTGDLGVRGNVDRSELRKVSGDSLEHFEIGERLKIKNEDEIIRNIMPSGADFIGLEDPDIWIDEKSGRMHVYFTVPFKFGPGDERHTQVSLGHAAGRDLDSLEMTMPVLQPTAEVPGGAKEVSIAPLNRQGFRYNLVESSERGENGEDIRYSTVRVAISENMGKPWRFGELVFHPAEHNIPWALEDASPGPLLPKSFIDVGEGKLLGVMNGRAARQKTGDTMQYGNFTVGLFVYDYENGKIEWVSPTPLIRDSEARNITFASQFVEQGKGSGVLYAHVDDSFVRAYTLNADEIKKLLKNL